MPSVSPEACQLSTMDNLFDAGEDIDTFAQTEPEIFPSRGRSPLLGLNTRPPRIGSIQNVTFVAGAIALWYLDPALATALPVPSYGNPYVVPSQWTWIDDTLSEVSESDRSLHHDALRSRIEKFCALPANWDGDGGVAPSAAAGAAANSFLSCLAQSNLPDECHAVGDGEIVFQWRRNSSFIETAFDGNTISWYARIEEEPVYGNDDFGGETQIDPRLLEAIRQLS